MALQKFDIDPANVDPDGLADNNSSAGATVTLDGALTSGGTFTSADGLAHRLDIIDTGADVQTAATYTITGTSSNGEVQTEAIAGPGSGATIETTQYFLTVTSIAITSPVVGSTVDIGTVDEIMAPIYPLHWRAGDEATIAVLGLSGTCVFHINQTFDDLSDRGVGIASANWIVKEATKSADLVSALTRHATGVQLTISSYTNTAEFQFHINQLAY